MRGRSCLTQLYFRPPAHAPEEFVNRSSNCLVARLRSYEHRDDSDQRHHDDVCRKCPPRPVWKQRCRDERPRAHPAITDESWDPSDRPRCKRHPRIKKLREERSPAGHTSANVRKTSATTRASPHKRALIPVSEQSEQRICVQRGLHRRRTSRTGRRPPADQNSAPQTGIANSGATPAANKYAMQKPFADPSRLSAFP